MSSLFRKEVVEARRGDWLGTIMVATPVTRWYLTLLAVALAGFLAVFLSLGRYTRRETVVGQVLPGAGLLNVVAPSAGTVSRLLVEDGQSVKAGAVLLELSSDQDSAALGNTPLLVGRQLAAQRSQLQSDLSDQDALARQRAEGLRDRIALLQAQISQIGGQVAIEKQQVASYQALLEKIEPLSASGYVSSLQIQQQRAATLDAKSQYRALVRQGLDARQQLESAKQELAQLPLDTASKRSEIERQLASVSQSIAQNEFQRAMVVRAPRDGVVSTVLPKVGQSVAAGQALLSILPAGSSLQAQLLVPSRAIGFIDVGNRVVLRYEAFPYQKFGQQYGHVIDISRSALSPMEVTSLTGQQGEQPLYRVQVKLDRQFVEAYGHDEPLKPGMALQADILMDRRTLLEWVFEPLYGMRRHLTGGEDHG